MPSNLGSQSSFLRLHAEKEKILLAQFRHNIIQSMVVEDGEDDEDGGSRKNIKKEKVATKITKCVRKLDCVCCARLRSFVYNIFMVVQSNFGLLVILATYAIAGAVMFSYLEGDEERRLRGEMVRTKRSFILAVEQLVGGVDCMAGGKGQTDESLKFPEQIQSLIERIKYSVNESRGWMEGNRTREEDDGIWLNRQSQASNVVAYLLESYEEALKKMPAQILLYGPDSLMKEWSFIQSLFFCATVVTTIGYGSVNPVTMNGRIATMIYGCFGIPLCLIFLSRMGKILTRAIKFLWSFIRRFYHTGSCRRVRNLVPLGKMKTQVFDKAKDKMKTEVIDKLSEMATSKSVCMDLEAHNKGTYTKQYSKDICEKLDLLKKFDSHNGGGKDGESGEDKEGEEDEKEGENKKEKGKDEKEEYQVDDTFNLPPIIALVVGVGYIFLGALLYKQWEDWTYLEAFYFTFISLSTIGFGDVIPDHPKFFLASFIYLLSGLSLIAMVINVVMEAVDSTINKASSVFNFRKRIQSVAPNFSQQFSLQRRVSV